MSAPLLVELYATLPQARPTDDPDLLAAGSQDAVKRFRDGVKARYTEGTLQRLLHSPDPRVRQASVLALGLLGTMRSNQAVAAAMHDDDPVVRKLAADAVWELWFRGGTPDQNWQLQQALRLPDIAQSVAALDELVRTAPDFAEAHNQRAVLYFRRGEYGRSAAGCEATLRLNPFHFGAAAGMGQCYVRMNKPRAALRAFQQAIDINPSLDHLKDTIRGLKASLDGDRD